MLNSVRPFAKFLSSFAFATTLGFAAQAIAQTVIGPQLLPVGPKVVLAGGATANPASGAFCVTGSTLKSTDAYGDGCLATQVYLPEVRYAVVDAQGTVFIADYLNGLVRRIDPVTGVINTVAGGAASSPVTGTPCGLNSSIDVNGDGCNSLLVKLGGPAGMAFDTAGNLYFADLFNYNVRKIAATGGVIPVTGGIITNVAGNAPTTGTSNSGVYGYTVSNATVPTSIISATASFVDGPYGVAFDKNGILYIAEEFKDSILAVNVTSTAQTVYGVTLQPGEIWKVFGAPSGSTANATGPALTCVNGNKTAGGTYGCTFGAYAVGNTPGTSFLDAPFAVAFDPTGNMYVADMFEESIPEVVASTGLIANFAGVEGSKTITTTGRNPAATTGIGVPVSVASDNLGDIYISDATNGYVWRVDADTKTLYAVATGFGTNSSLPSTTSSVDVNPGIYGVTADKYDNLYVADTVAKEIIEATNGTNFGLSTSSTVMIHFFKGDSEKLSGITVAPTGSSVGNTTFSAVPGTCTNNADTSYDCPVVITATPTALGPYTGSLTITSTAGNTVTYPLTGLYQPTPVTTTKLAFAPSTVNCTGGSTYATTTSFTFTATVTSVGGNVSGQVQFYNGILPIGSPVTPTNNVATLPITFTNTGTYNITAKFLGDTYYTASTSSPAITFTLASPTLYLIPTPSTPTVAAPVNLSTVTAGQTALYSFNTVSSVYGGNISFACTNLPANSSCVFSPAVLTSDACGTGATVALSILTKGSTAFTTSGVSGRGAWPMVLMFAGLASALLIGLRRRQLGARLGSISMAFALLLAGTGLMSCSGGPTPILPATPKGSYTVTVTALPLGTATTPAGQSQTIMFPLVVK